MTNKEHIDAAAALGAKMNECIGEETSNAVILSALLLMVAALLDTAPLDSRSLTALRSSIPAVLALMLPNMPTTDATAILH